MKNNTQKHIDIVIRFFYPVTAGIETSVLQTYSSLVEKGWDVTVHTSNDIYLEKNVLKSNEIIKGLKIKRYPFKWYGFIPDINWDTTNIISLQNSDIFPHIFILLRSLYRKLTNKKKHLLIMTPHGGFNPEWTNFSLVSRYIKKIYHYSLLTLLMNVSLDGVRAVSDWEKEQIIKHNVNKNLVVVIKNGIEDEAYKNVEKLASKKIKKQVTAIGKYIFQMGRVYRIKNYETVIKALPLLPEDISYVIAGPIQSNNGYLDQLKLLTKKLGVEHRVIFLGTLQGIDKFYVIKKAQMMVHMALWESFCNVVHEAMSQGKVCIVANNTALPYLVKDGINGFCIETKDFIQLAKKINYVLLNKTKPNIKLIEKTNKEICQKETWKSIGKQLETFYKSKLY